MSVPAPPESIATSGSISATAEQTPTLATRNIEVHVSGNVGGQLAVGNNNLQVIADHGAVVTLYNGKPIVPRRRPVPVLLPPRAFPGLLGRGTELAAAKNSLRASQPFEYYAEPGWGKTALLRYLAQVGAGSYPDGIVYQPAGRQPLADLQQFLFDAFYETDVPFVPTPGELREALQPLRALVVLDDLDLDRDQVDALLSSAPQSEFLVASHDRTLWGSGQADKVAGLDKAAALELFERELGRLLTADEAPAFERLWSSLEGNPLGLVQAAALSRETDRTLTIPGVTEPRTTVAASLTPELVRSLNEDERKVLELLASVYDAALPPGHVAAITGLGSAPTILSRLTKRGLTEEEDAGYRLKMAPAAGTVASQQWTEPAIRHFAAWCEQFASHPAQVLEVADAALKILELARDTQRHWSEVMELVRAMEPSLALSGRWGAWQRILNSGLQAAQALGDKAGEAWMLHQLGTRALCLGDAAAASTFLNQALRLRIDLGDTQGAAVTRQNLQRLAPAPGPVVVKPPKPPHRPLLSVVNVVLSLLVLAIAAGGWLVGHAVGDGQLAFQPAGTIDAGTVPVGQTSTKSIAIHNVGRGDLVLAGFATSGDFTATSNCPLAPQKLAADRGCSVEVTFLPRVAGPRTGTLTVTEPGGSTHVLGLAGVGSAGAIALSPDTMDFGNQAIGIASARKSVTIRNSGNASLALQGIAVTSDFQLTSQCPSSPVTLDAGQSCIVTVQFTPTAAGHRSGTVTITDQSGTHAVALTGQGIFTWDFRPNPVDFGNVQVNTQKAAEVELVNTSGASLTLKQISTSSKYFVESDRCLSLVIAPHGTCYIYVRFFPPAIGRQSDALTVTDTAGDQERDPLIGVGVTVPVAAITPTYVDWQKDPNTPNPASITLTNNGTGMLDVKAVQLTKMTASNPIAFGITTDGCTGQQLAPGYACQVRVQFTRPYAYGDYYGVVQFTDNASTSPQEVMLHGFSNGA